MDYSLTRIRSGRRGFTAVELALAATIFCTTALVTGPLVARTASAKAAAACQRNLKTIGVAMSMYAADHGGTLPTQRRAPDRPMDVQAFLSPPDEEQRLVTWVEGTERYFAGAGVPSALRGKTRDAPSIWRCPQVGAKYWPTPTGRIPDWGDARVTYAMSHLLLETTPDGIREPAKTMLVREAGLRMHSYIAAVPGTSNTVKPHAIFLPDPDNWGNPNNPASTPDTRLHNDGSHVLLADGHVKWFANSVANSDNVTNFSPARPGAWCLSDHGDPQKVLLWITP